MSELNSSTVYIMSSDNSLSSEKQPEDNNPKTKNNNFLTKYSDGFKKTTLNFTEKNKSCINNFIYVFLNVGFVAYFAYASYHFWQKGYDQIPFCDDDEYGILILLVLFVYTLIFYSKIFKPHVLPIISKSLKPITQSKLFNSSRVKWIFYLVFLIGVLLFLIIDSLEEPERLIALGGFGLMLLFGFVTSEHPGQINWSPVIRGLILQFVLGLLTIRWETGRNFFKCTGDKVSTFLNYTSVGSSFVYGDFLISNNVFAFQALSVIFFLSFFVKILYFYGVIQKVVLSLGIFLQSIMGTTICESVNSAANIFLGMTEAPILLEPYLQNLTHSETFAVMTAGFASVSGTVLAAYISFGAKPAHLITASVMSAPAALCYGKLNYPETEESVSTSKEIKIPDSEETSVLDAASRGASQAVVIVLGITANVIAFVTFVAFLNGLLNWFGVLVGFDNWSVEEGLSYVFMPLSYLMGVPWSECKYIGKLIGIKTAINEFSAYKELGLMLNNKLLSKRSEVIATYAICGFSNPGSVGIMLSTLGTLMPNKRDAITSMIFKSFIAGAIVCFMTACIAGMLISPNQF